MADCMIIEKIEEREFQRKRKFLKYEINGCARLLKTGIMIHGGCT
jgi:hypothetical protein